MTGLKPGWCPIHPGDREPCWRCNMFPLKPCRLEPAITAEQLDAIRAAAANATLGLQALAAQLTRHLLPALDTPRTLHLPPPPTVTDQKDQNS